MPVIVQGLKNGLLINIKTYNNLYFISSEIYVSTLLVGILIILNNII